jgi:hypothetical protein
MSGAALLLQVDSAFDHAEHRRVVASDSAGRTNGTSRPAAGGSDLANRSTARTVDHARVARRPPHTQRADVPPAAAGSVGTFDPPRRHAPRTPVTRRGAFCLPDFREQRCDLRLVGAAWPPAVRTADEADVR